ncbi:MAG: carboxypeptidase regulatory-like domain-containing protein [Armatimonadetes bacterium]|nr:carboxypeptidase regulatory-like domain-containing protein [Armatimonadota bacterium]
MASLARGVRMVAGLAPRRMGAVVALAGIAWVLAYALSQEIPVGGVQGQVTLASTGRPLGGARITVAPLETTGKERGIRYARTGRDGRFALAQVAAGAYQVTAQIDAHAVQHAEITVVEGRTSQVTLTLAPAKLDLTLAQGRRLFTTAERAELPVRGYVDGGTPAGERTLRVRIFRTRLSEILQDETAARALNRLGDVFDVKGPIPPALLRPRSGVRPELLWERDLPITEADAEGFFTKRVDFGPLPSGLYLVDVANGDAIMPAWIVVTDTALVLKNAPGQLLAYVTDVNTGVPVPGSTVRLYRRGQVFAERATDGRGLVEFRIPGGVEEFRLLAVAIRGADEAVVDRTDYRFEQAGTFALFAYTDRPIYRPGQRIYYKGVARRKVGGEARYAVPSGQEVTVELRDPTGEPVLRERRATGDYGTFHGQVDISAEAPTGTYTLVLSAGGSEYTHDVVIASYRKPEFSITAAPDKRRYVRGDTVEIALTARYYFGSPVAGGKVKYAVYRSPDWLAEYAAAYGAEEVDEEEIAERYGWYAGDGQTYAQGEVALDASGRGVIRFRADVAEMPDGPQQYLFTAQLGVTDPSGREASADTSVQVVPGAFRLAVLTDGYLAAPGTPSHVIVEAKDYEGRPVPRTPLRLDVFSERWIARTGRAVTGQVGTWRAEAGADGKATFEFTPPREGFLRLRAQARDARGREIRGTAYLWAVAGAGGMLEARYTDLSLLTDKRRYAPGETARVLINADRTGQTVLLTVEGERIYRAQTVPITARSTVVQVPVLAEYGPNVFLSAVYVRDKRVASSQAALRVDIPARELRVSITPDRPKYGPGEKITYAIQITDASGQPARAEFSLGVVDESIYALREDDPRALRNAFYPRRYNQVRTIFSFAVRYLGDADKAEPRISARRRFEDTAYWNPALRTDERGQAAVTFALPDNLTTWRASVTALTPDTRLGRQTQKSVVAKDFLVRVEIPRLLTQGDQSRILAVVHNDTGAAETASVRLRADGLTVNGPEVQAVAVEPGKTATLSWPVTPPRAGDAKVTVTAWTPGGAGRKQYTDGVELPLRVRPYGREEVAYFSGDVAPDAPAAHTFTVDPAAIPEATRLTIRVTPSVINAVVGGLEYVIGYPYGCMEQTMSRFLPSVMARKVLRAAGVKDARLDAELPRMVRDGLTRVYRFQRENGAWGWFEFDDDNPWMTAYTLYGLAVARAEGWPVSENAAQRGREAALRLAQRAPSDTRMFLLYAAALAGDRDGVRAAYERAKPDLQRLGPAGFAYTVLLEKLLGGDPRSAFEELGRRAVSADGVVHWQTSRDDRWDWDNMATTAIGLRAVLAVDPKDTRVGPILRWMMRNRTGHYWWSTRATSWALAAVTDYLAAGQGAAALTGEVRVRLNGQVVGTVRLTPEVIDRPDIVLTLPASALRAGQNNVSIERTEGSSRVFYTARLVQTVGAAEIPALSTEGITLRREYLRIAPKKVGQDAWALHTETTGNQLNRGDDILVRLTLETPRDLAYAVIEDPFPAGLEVTERGSTEVDAWTFWWTSIDVRDDRVVFFARRIKAGKHAIEYRLRAQTPGTFRALPAVLQQMYDPATRAESPGARVVIR